MVYVGSDFLVQHSLDHTVCHCTLYKLAYSSLRFPEKSLVSPGGSFCWSLNRAGTRTPHHSTMRLRQQQHLLPRMHAHLPPFHCTNSVEGWYRSREGEFDAHDRRKKKKKEDKAELCIFQRPLYRDAAAAPLNSGLYKVGNGEGGIGWDRWVAQSHLIPTGHVPSICLKIYFS